MFASCPWAHSVPFTSSSSKRLTWNRTQKYLFISPKYFLSVFPNQPKYLSFQFFFFFKKKRKDQLSYNQIKEHLICGWDIRRAPKIFLIYLIFIYIMVNGSWTNENGIWLGINKKNCMPNDPKFEYFFSFSINFQGTKNRFVVEYTIDWRHPRERVSVDLR